MSTPTQPASANAPSEVLAKLTGGEKLSTETQAVLANAWKTYRETGEFAHVATVFQSHFHPTRVEQSDTSLDRKIAVLDALTTTMVFNKTTHNRDYDLYDRIMLSLGSRWLTFLAKRPDLTEAIRARVTYLYSKVVSHSFHRGFSVLRDLTLTREETNRPCILKAVRSLRKSIQRRKAAHINSTKEKRQEVELKDSIMIPYLVDVAKSLGEAHVLLADVQDSLKSTIERKVAHLNSTKEKLQENRRTDSVMLAHLVDVAKSLGGAHVTTKARFYHDPTQETFDRWEETKTAELRSAFTFLTTLLQTRNAFSTRAKLYCEQQINLFKLIVHFAKTRGCVDGFDCRKELLDCALGFVGNLQTHFKPFSKNVRQTDWSWTTCTDVLDTTNKCAELLDADQDKQLKALRNEFLKTCRKRCTEEVVPGTDLSAFVNKWKKKRARIYRAAMRRHLAGKKPEWNSIIKSLVVVPGEHGHEHLKPPKDAVNWDRSPMRNKEYAEKAVVVDHRPFDTEINATLVVWNSGLPHCNGTWNDKLSGKRKRGFSPQLTTDGHFVADSDSAAEYAHQHGFCVLELVDFPEYERLIELYRRSVQLVNKAVIDPESPDCPDISKITADHLPPYKTKGLQQFYGFCHTPFANACREVPAVKAFFSKLYDCPQHAMYCSIDASAVALERGSNENWLHRDQTKAAVNHQSWQGTLYLKPPTEKYKRLAQMVAWHPTEYGVPEREELEQYARERGACLTHNNARVNKEANKFTGHLAMRKEKLEKTFKVYIPGKK
jgi:hypothetical protein